MSPEMLLKRPYCSGVDIWACGVTAYLMLFGNYPHREKTGCSAELVKAAIRDGQVEPSYKANHGFPQPSAAACQFVAWLLARNPEQRPIASDAIHSAFLQPALPPPDTAPPRGSRPSTPPCSLHMMRCASWGYVFLQRIRRTLILP